MLSKTLCVQCSKEFEPANKRNIYCSDACKQEAYRRRNGIETPIFLRPQEEKFHIFKTEKKEIVYREVYTREYTDLRTKIAVLNNDLILAKSEEKSIENKVNRLLGRNESLVAKKIASLTTIVLGLGLGAVFYFLLRFKITRAILFILAIPFVVIVVLAAIAFQKKSDENHEDKILELPRIRQQLEAVKNTVKSIESAINDSEIRLNSIPQFERLTEEETKEIEEKVKQPKFGIATIKENDAKNVMSLIELQNVQFKTLDFKDDWKDLVGTPEQRFSMMVYGKPGHGKSTLAIKFSEYLSNNFGNVTYNSAEEGVSLTLQDKLKGVKSKNLSLTSFKDYNSIKKYLKKSNCNFIILDSVNHMGLTPEQVEELKGIDKTRSFISIHQVTKTGEFKGDNKFLHNCDIEIMVENRLPIVKKNRYKVN